MPVVDDFSEEFSNEKFDIEAEIRAFLGGEETAGPVPENEIPHEEETQEPEAEQDDHLPIITATIIDENCDECEKSGHCSLEPVVRRLRSAAGGDSLQKAAKISNTVNEYTKEAQRVIRLLGEHPEHPNTEELRALKGTVKALALALNNRGAGVNTATERLEMIEEYLVSAIIVGANLSRAIELSKSAKEEE